MFTYEFGLRTSILPIICIPRLSHYSILVSDISRKVSLSLHWSTKFVIPAWNPIRTLSSSSYTATFSIKSVDMSSPLFLCSNALVHTKREVEIQHWICITPGVFISRQLKTWNPKGKAVHCTLGETNCSQANQAVFSLK